MAAKFFAGRGRTAVISAGFALEKLRNLPCFARLGNGEPRNFRTQRIRFGSRPPGRAAVPALFEIGHDTAENNPNHDCYAYDNEKPHGDLGALRCGPGKRIKVYNNVMAVGHQQGYRGQREQNQKKKF
jgi:hypothetical protein